MSDEKTPLEQAFDLFVFAPLGVAITIRDQLPELADKGRQQITNQLAVARMMGQFAVTMGRQEAAKRLTRAREQAETVVASARPARRDAPGRAARPVPASVPVPASTVSGNGQAPAPHVSELAIPGYDTLSASQIVQRLGGLSAEELEVVRSYEAARRGRKTILHRVAQLQGNGVG